MTAPGHVPASAAESEREAAEERARRADVCNTCGGSPPESNAVCVCGGTGLARDELLNMRTAAIRAGEIAAELCRERDKTHVGGLAHRLAAAESEREAAEERAREAEAILGTLADSNGDGWAEREARNHFGRHGRRTT